MKRTLALLALTSALGGCAFFSNPDTGEPEIAGSTQKPVPEMLSCIQREAEAHHASVRNSPLPQGAMLDFGDSNIVKIRTDDTGRTSYRFYPGKRHLSTNWIDAAMHTCAG